MLLCTKDRKCICLNTLFSKSVNLLVDLSLESRDYAHCGRYVHLGDALVVGELKFSKT